MSESEALVGAVVLVAMFLAPLLACVGIARLVEFFALRTDGADEPEETT